MRTSLISSVLLLAACDAAGSADFDHQMTACGDWQRSADAAMAVCSTLLAEHDLSNPARVYVLISRARGAIEKQDMQAALVDLDEALRLDPTRATGYASRGIVHGATGKLDRALQDFDRAIELKPDEPAVFQNRGKTFSDLGRQERAIQDFTRSINLGNDIHDTRNGRCWARAVLGEELERAREDCEAAVRMQPRDGNTFNSLAFVRFRLGDYAGAINDYTTSLSLNPNGASSFYMRGRAKAMLDDATASADIEKGISLEPGIAARYRSYGIE